MVWGDGGKGTEVAQQGQLLVAPATICSVLDQEQVVLFACPQSGSAGNKVLSGLGIYFSPTNLILGDIRVTLLLCIFSLTS